MFNDESDDILGYEFHDYNLFKIFEALKTSSELLADLPTEEIVSRFRKLHKPDDRDMYCMSENDITNFMNDMVNEIINETLMEMAMDGVIDMSFDNEKNDFVFFLNKDNA